MKHKEIYIVSAAVLGAFLYNRYRQKRAEQAKEAYVGFFEAIKNIIKHVTG